MIQHGKIQVGDIILDAEIDIDAKFDMENKPLEPEVVQLFRAFVNQFPTWRTANEAQVVDGSIVEPITDEKRLLK